MAEKKGQIWESRLRTLNPEDPQLSYRRRTGEKKTAIHWGQRKLLLSEIEFLNFFWDPKKISNPAVVYAGAAPGTHVSILTQLYPQITWHLYDPRPFHIAETPKIKLYSQLFLDADARKWGEQQKKEGNVFFLSDIRTGSVDHDAGSNEKFEREVINNMQMQQNWLLLMTPVAASLKFRLPYVTEESKKMFPDLLYPYLYGYIFLQPWAPMTSSETRLVPIKDEKGQYIEHKYNMRVYEDQMFYHNAETREKNRYIEPFEVKSGLFQGKTLAPLDPPELLNDYDSTLEIVILGEYLAKMYGRSQQTLDNARRLSRYITSMFQQINPHSKRNSLQYRRVEVRVPKAKKK